MAAGTETLQLPRAIAEQVLRHARAELPNEACGFLSGSLSERRVTGYHPARNAHRSPLRYAVDEKDQVRIPLAIDAAGEEVVAVFHSHTRSAAVPSPTDRRSNTYPDAFHLLASLADADAGAPPELIMRAWRISGGEAAEVGLALA
jgi:proteasome lid subunit RPN8/RPN11